MPNDVLVDDPAGEENTSIHVNKTQQCVKTSVFCCCLQRSDNNRPLEFKQYWLYENE
jgi:hypothetical protein